MNEANSETTYDFTPVDFDASELPPEAADGSYTATCKRGKIAGTAKDKYPMVIFEWSLDAALTGDDNSVGAELADFLTFFPKGHRAYRMCVARIRGLLDALGLDTDLIPTSITSKEDLEPLVEAVEGQTMTVYVTSQKDKRNGGTRATIGYAAPRGTVVDDTEDAKPVAVKKNGNGAKPAAKKNGRR
jgi:hypothetical protein